MAQKRDKILWAALWAFEAEFCHCLEKVTERLPQLCLAEEVDGEGVDGEGSDIREDGEVV
jgi:hypothetical protein